MSLIISTEHTEFLVESEADLIADIPCFDPFDPDMSARDRRDVAETYAPKGERYADLEWLPLELVGARISVET